MKKNIGSIIFVLVLAVLGYWWYFTYTFTPTATLIYKTNDSEIRYEIAYKYTDLIIRNEKDSAYIFYNKNGKSLIVIENKDWNKITIIKK